MKVDEGVLGIIITATFAIGLFCGIKFGTNGSKDLIAKGEIVCEYDYGDLKCWNPKEEK
tara:strand:- start:31315 stop:31491 length:177 start_codon:yes stop_codon:yes gene_type:complete